MTSDEQLAGVTSLPTPKLGDGRPCVLLVEDEPLISKIVGELLDESGYQHVSIADHEQIAATINRWRPQCIILDSEPGSAGHERSWADAAAIRRAHPEVPVLMFTADPDATAEARAGVTPRSKAAGYAGVLDKPFLVIEFLATLKHAVDAPKAAPLSDGRGLEAEAFSVFPALGAAAGGWAPADFFATAVHELRTPLTSIMGEVEFGLRIFDTDPGRARESMSRTLVQAHRMNRLLGELLDNARVTVGAVSLEVVTFDLGVAIALTIREHEHGGRPRITFHHPTEPICVRGDPDRLGQVIGNLLDNALKYSPAGAPITVSLSKEGQEACMRVVDRGTGIAPEEAARIFAPFYRVARTRDIPGTGLGLHISRRIAEQHRGRLWLERSSDDGSVFTLLLPVADPWPQRSSQP